MNTAAPRSKLKHWRSRSISLFCLGAALVGTIAHAASAPITRDFWIRDHKTSAGLRGSGFRTLVYVEDKLFNHGISGDFVSRMVWQLEQSPPSGAYLSDTGVVPFEERLFGALPRRASGDDRLIVLFADLGLDQDGLFNPNDLLSDSESMQKFHQHSNEANLIYVNGFRKNESNTTSVIARELPRLLSSQAREGWLSGVLSEGAMMLSGFFGDQELVDKSLADSGSFPLVSPAPGSSGPQLLFSSFLLDSLPAAHNTAISALSHIDLSGRDAVEKLFQQLTEVPLNFDAIFSNFVSYVFAQAASGAALPSAWRHSPSIRALQIAPYFTYEAGSGELTGRLAPYSFVAVDLAQELSPNAEIRVQRVDPDPPLAGGATDCSKNATVLWKPVNKRRIAIYAMGCNPASSAEMVQFRLRILDQP
ncbi:MAG: hypothetical protein ACXVCI_05560 [Bdellovibrionota bacterium]